jgi:hypothetical protein
MGIEDRDWYRRDYEKRRKQIEEREKEELRRKRQIGVDAMWNEVEPSKKPSYNRPDSYIEKARINRKKSPIWMRLVQVFGALAVLAVVFLVIANTEWGGNFLKNKDIKIPAIHLPSTAGKDVESTTMARSEPTSNTALIPSYLVYDGSTQAEYDHFAEEYGISSVKKGADGSVLLDSDSNIIHGNVDALVAVLSKKCGESEYRHFVSISVNEDHTKFTITVNDVNISEEEKQAETDLFLMAGLQAVQTGQAIQNICMETVNMLGNFISAKNTNPDPNAVLHATQTESATVSNSKAIDISASEVMKEPSYEGTCTFNITLPDGDDDYYIYLKYIKPSSKSVTERNKVSNNDVDDIAIYVKANERFSCQVPVGIYQLYYTFGDTWYGTEKRFGTGAPVFKAVDLLEFYNDGKNWWGLTLQLERVRNGNLETTQVFGSEVPP